MLSNTFKSYNLKSMHFIFLAMLFTAIGILLGGIAVAETPEMLLSGTYTYSMFYYTMFIGITLTVCVICFRILAYAGLGNYERFVVMKKSKNFLYRFLSCYFHQWDIITNEAEFKAYPKYTARYCILLGIMSIVLLLVHRIIV